MKVLVACEESQAVCKAFRELGHDTSVAVRTKRGRKYRKADLLMAERCRAFEPRIIQKPEIAYHEWVTPDGKKKRQSLWYYNTRCLPHDQRAAAASKTFIGISRAMAEQWGGAVVE